MVIKPSVTFARNASRHSHNSGFENHNCLETDRGG